MSYLAKYAYFKGKFAMTQPENIRTVQEAELQLKIIEIKMKQLEFEQKNNGNYKLLLGNPFVVTTMAAILTIFGNIVVNSLNASHQLENEKIASQGNLIIEAMKAGNARQAAENLEFLQTIGLLPKEQYPELAKYVENSKTTELGAFLPSSNTSESPRRCPPQNLNIDEIKNSLRKEFQDKQSARWMNSAINEIGVCEHDEFGKERIEQYWSTLPSIRTSSENMANQPWAVAFVNWVFKSSGIEPAGSATGFDWQKWGRGISTPEPGSVVVATRGLSSRDTPGPRTVGFYIRDVDENNILVLGGNFADQVRLLPIAKSRVVAYRLPTNL
jgi:uncharacterized protein (TIGR02594 family)